MILIFQLNHWVSYCQGTPSPIINLVGVPMICITASALNINCGSASITCQSTKLLSGFSCKILASKIWVMLGERHEYIHNYVPTRKGYYMYNYMGRGRPNGMESIGNNCQDNLPKGSLSASCTAFVSFSVHGSWSGLVGGCGILKKSWDVAAVPWWPRWTPYQPTLDRSHGLRIFCWNETKGTTQNTRSRPSARSFTALECCKAATSGVLWSLGETRCLVLDEIWWETTSNRICGQSDLMLVSGSYWACYHK